MFGTERDVSPSSSRSSLRWRRPPSSTSAICGQVQVRGRRREKDIERVCAYFRGFVSGGNALAAAITIMLHHTAIQLALAVLQTNATKSESER